MKKLGILSIIAFLLLAALLSWNLLGLQVSYKPQTKEVKSPEDGLKPEEGLKQKEVQTSDAADVTIRVKPAVLEAGQQVVFKLNMDTHSVELDYDLVNQSTLIDSLGNNLKPLSWSGGQGGHHLSGDLTFPKLDENARSVELVIKGIAGSDRNFKWNL